MKFQGKTVLVTGAAKGVGKVIAERFAEEKATVFINDVDIKEAEKVASYITSSGLEAFTLKADVSNSSEVEKSKEDNRKMSKDRYSGQQCCCIC